MTGPALHLRIHGTGPELVMVHGWGLHGGLFDTVAEQLARRFRVLAVDLPGYGNSPHEATSWNLDDLCDRLARVVDGAAHWLGWSLGGLLCLALADRYPQRVTALSLVAAPPRFTAGPDWPDAMDRATFDRFAGGLNDHPEQTLQTFAGLVAYGDRHARKVRRAIDAVRNDRPQPDPVALRSGLELLASADLVDAADRLTMTPHWLFGGRDALVPAGAADAVRARWPHHRVTTFSDAGHAPFLSDLERFINLLDTPTDG